MNGKGEQKENWICATLLNDETSTDDEMREYFIKEGPMNRAEAEFYINQRNRAFLENLNFELEIYNKGAV